MGNLLVKTQKCGSHKLFNIFLNLFLNLSVTQQVPRKVVAI